MRRNRKMGGEEDRLSDLPEELLHHIFSFLTTKEVIRTTCLLSKTWRYFWVSVPYLRFDIVNRYEDHPQRSTTNFFNEVLRRRDSSWAVRRLHFRWFPLHNANCLNALIATALNQNIQEFDIYLENEDPIYEISEQVFASSIRTFKLESYPPVLPYHLPDSMVSAPNLRVLELVRCLLPMGNSDDELVLSCPVLEILVLKNCVHDHLEVLNLSTNRLKKLEIENLKSVFSGDCILELHTPNLSSFVYRGKTHLDCSVGNLAALINADIWLHRSLRTQQVSCAIKLLKGLRSARTLSLGGFQFLARVPNALEDLLTSYSNLKNLELGTSLGTIDNVNWLASLLSSCSVIETLVLQVPQRATRKDKVEPMLPLPCTLNHLKYVAVRGVEGLNCELEFFRFLFYNGVNIERMVITGYSRNRAQKRRILMEFSDKLMTLSQQFPTVQVSFQIL